MREFDFDPALENLFLSFDCIKCFERQQIELDIPDQENIVGDELTSEGMMFCKCGEEYYCKIFITPYQGYGYIDGIGSDYRITKLGTDGSFNEQQYEALIDDQYDAIVSNTEFYETFCAEIRSLRELNAIKLANNRADKALRRQIYIGVISSMETYLSDAFINTTLNSDIFLKRFVATFKDFKNETISLNKLYDEFEKIKLRCRQSMLEIIFHNLAKVKGMYLDTLGVDFGSIAVPSKAVTKRHDLVHRNGWTKEKDQIMVDNDIITDLIVDIQLFIDNIEDQLKKL
ncbi:hypothetical protein [Fluviicola taffensis]|nr:hypothetical protein [Fluviicola taffensis]